MIGVGTISPREKVRKAKHNIEVVAQFTAGYGKSSAKLALRRIGGKQREKRRGKANEAVDGFLNLPGLFSSTAAPCG